MAKIYRVVVRGQFADLSEKTKADLLADAEAHDYLHSAFTKDGTFTYDERLVAFNIRYEVRLSDDEFSSALDAEEFIKLSSMERASAWLDESGYPHKKLTCTFTDMATIWDD